MIISINPVVKGRRKIFGRLRSVVDAYFSTEGELTVLMNIGQTFYLGDCQNVQYLHIIEQLANKDI